LIAGAGAVLGALLGGRRNTRSIARAAGSLSSRHGMSSRAAQRKETAEHRAQEAADDLEQLEQELLDDIAEIDERWKAKAAEIETVAIRLEATDVQVVETRLVWVPST
jgi:molecular chaperone GrpE (heat shock protein)